MTQPADAPPTKAPDQQPPDPPDGEAFITAKGSVNCLATPSDGSELSLVFSPGETAPVLGTTPNKKWFAVKPEQGQKPCWVVAAEVDLNVDPGSLEVLPLPATSTPALGSVAGVLWHEICEYSGGQAGEPVVLGQGCEQWGAESYEFGPNQVYDAFESGWEGVTLHLGAGPCPSTGLATTVTNADGEYIFSGLSSGPTFPERGEDGFYQTVNLAEGEDAIGVDFGYAWQFYN